VSDPSGFPLEAIEGAMDSLGKSITFNEAEVDELLNLRYDGQKTFSVLSILYPGLDLSKVFHEDHIVPKSRFTRRKLQESGVPVDEIEDYIDKVNLLPNLQLLGGVPNQEKQTEMPGEWIHNAFPNEERKQTYLTENDLDPELLPKSMPEFARFFDDRSKKIKRRLVSLLGSKG